MDPATQTPAEEVGSVVRWLNEHHATYQINGGWAVDALHGRQTRPHRDLDVFLDAAHVPDLLRWLAGRGYQIAEDWRPIRVELTSTQGVVDVHPMVIGPNGDGVQQGLGSDTYLHRAVDRTTGIIGDTVVVVATAARLRSLRDGYEPRPVDHHDLALLEQLV